MTSRSKWLPLNPIVITHPVEPVIGLYTEQRPDKKFRQSPFAAGLGDHRINTALCPGGKERMRRLLNVVASGRLDLGALVTHQYKPDDIVAAYDLFANQRDGVLKIAIKSH
jgi:threonine dehydrogenase-like Zn-dependent dehydrogenase